MTNVSDNQSAWDQLNLSSQRGNESLSVLSSDARMRLFHLFASVTGVAMLSHFALLGYIIWTQLYRNFISCHFIAHRTVTSIVVCGYLLPIFIYNFHENDNLFHKISHLPRHDMLDRFYAFSLSTVWIVTHFMTASIAGVHLLTFARIHYDQLFGISPSIICLFSWVVGASISLPCLTNHSIVSYSDHFYQSFWNNGNTGIHLVVYVTLLGYILPLGLTVFAYGKVLIIFYECPLVFQALGVFRARYLMVLLMVIPLSQAPLYIISLMDPTHVAHYEVAFPVVAFVAHLTSLSNSVIYGLSIYMMKEDDMALVARAQKQYKSPMHLTTVIE